MCPEAISFFEGSSFKDGALSLKPDVSHTLDSLYAFYHRQWWCYSHMYRAFKFCQALLNRVALLVVAAGMIAGSICENSIAVTCLAAWGTVRKGWNDFKKFPINEDRCQFAYTTYAKILTELRTYARGIPFDEDSFLVKMQTFDDTITDFSPAISDRCMQNYHCRFYYVSLEGLSSTDGCSRPPMSNASHAPLKEVAQPSCVQWRCFVTLLLSCY